MIEGAASILGEIIAPIVSFTVEATLFILIAAFRPWHYVLSPEFRAKVNQQHAHRHPVFKWLFLLWGSFMLIASIAVIICVVWFISQMVEANRVQQEKSLSSRALHNVEQAVTTKIQQAREGKQ
jgi:hypothetical protein